MRPRRGLWALFLFVAGILASPRAEAYSVLTHEAIVDAVWESSLRPLLLRCFPGATAEDLKAAHAAAYGGALMPDMGYFPGGAPFFTNLVHYVRSGDFVSALLREAKTSLELGFALGALSHYHADRWGHPLGTNRCVPILYPKSAKGADALTYEEAPLAHKRVEFGFDVLQTARGNYAPEAYHDFIGFQFADSLLARVFVQTYGLRIQDVFGNYGRAISLLRICVRDFFPLLAKSAWHNRRAEISKAQPGATSRSFRYRMRQKQYNKLFPRSEDRPRFFTRLFANVLFFLPKVGPLRPLKFKVPDRETEKIFIASFDTVTLHLRAYTQLLHEGKAPLLPNYDYDTGARTEPGEYQLTDQTYRCLLVNLHKEEFRTVPPALRSNLAAFFARGGQAVYPEKEKDRVKLTTALNDFKTAAR